MTDLADVMERLADAAEREALACKMTAEVTTSVNHRERFVGKRLAYSEMARRIRKAIPHDDD